MLISGFKRWAWLIFAVAVLFTLLGQRGLNEPDEGRYAEIAREMSVDGDWLVPHMNGLPHFQKPPVIYWLTAGSLRIFGHAEWAARLPSALMALGTVVLVFFLTSHLFDNRDRGVMAALVLSTLAGFFAMGRLLTPDMTMTFWIVAAITAAMYRRSWWFFILMGMGFLTKGPMALVVPTCAVLGWQYFCTPAEKLHLPWWRGLGLALGISVSWFVVLSIRNPELFDYFWKYELVQRFGSGAHGRSKPAWFFLMVLPLATVPWIFTLPVKRLWSKCLRLNFNAVQGMLLGWLLPPFGILSTSGSKLPTYVLPLMPAMAIAIAAFCPNKKRVWVIAVPTAVSLILGDFAVTRFNEQLGAQTSCRALAQVLKAQEPDEDEAILFACGTRTEGLAFYTDHLMKVTRNESDLASEPTPEQASMMYRSTMDCIKSLTDGPAAHGIVSTDRFERMFDPSKWRVIARSGAFSLIANHASHQVPMKERSLVFTHD